MSRNLRAAFSASLAALVLASCATMREASRPAPEVSAGSKIDHRVRIDGYESRDGTVHDWPDYVEPAGPDSLRLVHPAVPAHGIVGGEHAERVVIVARDEVWTLHRTSAAGPLIGLALLVTGIAILVLLAAASTNTVSW